MEWPRAGAKDVTRSMAHSSTSETALNKQIRKKDEFRETREGVSPAEDGFDIEGTQ
jgi:hypothetical protein